MEWGPVDEEDLSDNGNRCGDASRILGCTSASPRRLMTPVSDPVFLEVSKVRLGVHPVCAISEYVES